MSPAISIAIYCLACVVCSLLGGWLPLVVRLTHRRMQIAISFVSGVVLGIGVLHLVPHSFELLQSIDATVLWMMAGFLFMFFLERFFHFHHHEAPEEPMSLVQAPVPPTASHQHAPHGAGRHDHHAHDHDQAHTDPTMSSRFSWSGAAVGLTLHALIDGVAIAAAVKAESGHAGVILAGFGTALAVVLHKPFDALTIGTLMAAAGRSVSARQWSNMLYALVTPLGVGLYYLVSGGLSEPTAGLGQVLGFAAGAFVCIASSDLLPELQFHGHDRAQLSLALVAGIALAWATVFVEGGHDHHGHDDRLPAHEAHDHAHDAHEHEHEAHEHESHDGHSHAQPHK
ncbi:MAG: ZIP family metal transporter [Pirellulales bacterium]